MKFVILFISVSLFCIKGIAQHQYSLEDCFAAAEKNNITIKKSENDIQNSYIDKKAATYNLLPSLNASAGHYMSFGKSIDPVTNNFVHESFSGGDLNVTMQLNIFAGFNALNTIKSSLYRMQAGENTYKKTELEIFATISTAYATVMSSREQVATIRNNNLHTQNELNVIQEKINVGKLSKSDYYTINARYKSEQAALVAIQNDSLTAMNELKFLVGLNSNEPFNIKDIDSNEINAIVGKEFNTSEVFAKVLKDHPALLESMYNEKAANMELKAARGNLIPNVSLAGNVFSNYNLNDKYENGGHIPLNTQLNNNFGQTAGVFIEIPLFNKYQNRAAVEKAKVNLTNAKLATEEAENGIVKSTQQLLNDFISAKQQYLLQTEALQQGELSYNAFEEKHKLGYITSLELILAKDQLYEQQVKATAAKYDMYFKYKTIELLLNL